MNGDEVNAYPRLYLEKNAAYRYTQLKCYEEWLAESGRLKRWGRHEGLTRSGNRLLAHIANGQMQFPLHLLHAG